MRRSASAWRCGLAAAALLALPGTAAAQAAAGQPVLRVTFDQAVRMAIERNPSVAQAAQGILQAQALLNEMTALARPTVAGAVTATFLDKGTSINGVTATARNQLSGTVALSVPLIVPVQWALRVQAADSERVARLAASDMRKQVAVSTAQACLAIVALRELLGADVRSRDVARAHYEYAKQLRVAGAGSRLNEVRAQQAVSADAALVESSQADLYKAQEALGVLLAADGPADLVDEPVLDVPASLDAAIASMASMRTDLLLLAGREKALARIVSDSWKDWLPSVSGLFTPEFDEPQTLFQRRFSWRAQVVATVPIFDSGYRKAVKAGRQSDLETARIAQNAAARQAFSDVRTARDALQAAERALGFARDAAEQARQVVEIVNVSFRVGASTNIEVIDAQRVARDADTSVALAEHDVRQAKLNLLVALGLFPR